MDKQVTDWKSEYQRLMRERGFSEHDEEVNRQRRHTRLGLKAGTMVTVQSAAVPCQIANISVGGLSFYSNMPLSSGQEVTITIAEAMELNLRVESCHMEELPSVMMLPAQRYLIGARFLDLDGGYQVMAQVLANFGHTLFERSS